MTLRFCGWFAAIVAVFVSVSCAEKKATPAPAESTEDVSQATQIFGSPLAAPAAPELDPTSVVAVVNGKDITQADLNKEMMAFLSRLRGQVSPEKLSQIRPQLEERSLNAAISKILLTDAVAAEKVEVTEADLEAAIQNFKTNGVPGLTFEDLLKRNNMTLDEFKKQLSTDLGINKLLETHVKAEAPTDKELAAFYDGHPDQFTKPETVTASHILITTEATDTDAQKAEKKKKLEDLRAKLVAGEDFAKCASENSDCPSKAQGGNLGEFRRGMMVKPFEDAAFTQKVDEIGPMVETQFGYHIIKVTKHDEAGKITLDEVKERLSDYLLSQKRQESAEAFVKSLRDKAQITYPGGAPAPATEAPAAPTGS